MCWICQHCPWWYSSEGNISEWKGVGNPSTLTFHNDFPGDKKKKKKITINSWLLMGGPFIFLMSLLYVFCQSSRGQKVSSGQEEILYHIESLTLYGQFQRCHISRERWKEFSIKKKERKKELNFTKAAFSGDGKWPWNRLEGLILKMNLTLTWHWKMKMELVRHFLAREMPLAWHSFWWEDTFRG